MNKQVIAMVLVGGRGTRLENITKTIAKPAVPFGGKYKLIDFVLSNLSNSDINTCGIITQYEPLTLINYIGNGSTWDLDINDGGISFLTPYTTSTDDLWQKGTAHAILQHFRYIEHYNPEYVLILSGDHVYKMDYNKLIEDHIKKDADLTIATFTVNKNASRYGILQLNGNNEVVSFEEKPEYPKSKQASMGVYVFRKDVLKSLLDENKESNFDFGKDIIPLALSQKKRVYGYKFNGYFRDVGTVKSLFDANMDLIDNPHLLKLHEYKDFPVYTKSSNLPPHHIANKSQIKNSLISDGCLINSDIHHSVLGSGIVVGESGIIKNSLIFNNVKIGEGCYIKNAIILDDSVILPKTILDFKEITIVDNEYLWKLGDSNE